MSEFLNLKSIDISSITIIGTAINIIYAIIFTILFMVIGTISVGTTIIGSL